MPRKPTAHATRDQLQQEALVERVKARDIEAELEAAKAEVDAASHAVTDGYAREDERAVAQARKAGEAAAAKLRDLQHRVDGAALRIERAQRALDEFTRDNAEALLEEHAEGDRELALRLTRVGNEVVQLHRAYLARRMEVDALVAAIPGASPRTDGPPASYAWERQIKDLERAIRETPEVDPPLPRWHGLRHQQHTDAVHRSEQLKRKKRNTAEERELARLRKARGIA
jgi:hypothetical protein